MIESYVEILATDELIDRKNLSINQWGHQADFFDGDMDTDWVSYQVAIVGISVDEENETYPNCSEAPDLIRQAFYKLFNWENNVKLIDIGNVKLGENMQQTYQHLAYVVEFLLKNHVIPIILGGTHDLTYGQFMAYESQGEPIKMVVVDEKIDLFHPEEVANSNSYLYKVLAHQPNFISSFNHVCHQNYLVDPEMFTTLQKFHFSCHRLGEFKTNFKRIEPLVRNADAISVDIAALRSGDAPGQKNTSPHGLTGEEACQLARYTGFGENVSSFGVYEYFPKNDLNNQTAQLIAQLIWHFIDGYSARRYEYPELFEEEFLKYVAVIDQGQELFFVKSKFDEKWWIKVPIMDGDNIESYELVPCTYEDYLNARDKNEIPDRWLQHFIRLSK